MSHTAKTAPHNKSAVEVAINIQQESAGASRYFDADRRNFLAQLLSTAVLTAFFSTPLSASPSRYQDRLYTPTQITKLFGTYFIIDCWHHRILYSKNISTSIASWKTLDDDLAGPHSIASNGSVYVVDDTGRHALKIYRSLSDDKFELIQTVPNVGNRPHRVLYDHRNKQFLIIGSKDQSIHIFIEKNGKLVSVFEQEIVQLEKQYCRSITIQGSVLYFVGVNDILLFELKRHSIGKMIKKIKLDKKYTDSNDLFFYNNKAGFLTSTSKRIVSFETILDLERGTATDFSKKFKGTPYYIERFDNRIWIPEITEHSAISFTEKPNSKQLNIEKLFDFGPPQSESLIRKSTLPL